MKTEKIRKLPPDRESLVIENMGLIGYTIKRYLHMYPENPDWDDLFQTGCEALIYAAIHYDNSVSEFTTYAVCCIHGYCLKYIRECIMPLKPHGKERDFCQRMYAMQDEGRSEDEIIQALGITHKQYVQLSDIRYVNSIEATVSEDEPDGISWEKKLSYDSQMEDDLMEEAYLQSLDTVLKREHKKNPVVAYIYEDFVYSSIYEGKKPTQQSLADKYHVAQVTVSRIIRRLTKKYEEQLKQDGILEGGIK